MAICAICGKGTQKGHQVSHSKRRKIRFWKPNLQPRNLDGVRKMICTSCIKRMKVKSKVDNQGDRSKIVDKK